MAGRLGASDNELGTTSLMSGSTALYVLSMTQRLEQHTHTHTRTRARTRARATHTHKHTVKRHCCKICIDYLP